jgi:hypothetical protein
VVRELGISAHVLIRRQFLSNIVHHFFQLYYQQINNKINTKIEDSSLFANLVSLNFLLISFLFHSLAIVLELVPWGILILNFVSLSLLNWMAWRGTPVTGPSISARFWSITSTIAAVFPANGPKWTTAMRPISTKYFGGFQSKFNSY